MPGRKTDVKDCEWIADLLRHGLLRPSFVPDRSQRELRELTRYRTTLVRERAREVNRLQKTLEGANVKLGDVASDVLGTSGPAILAAMIAGTTDTAALADLARGRLRDKRASLERAVAGCMGAHQRFLLAEQLAHFDGLNQSIDRVSAEIAERVHPFDPIIERLAAGDGKAVRLWRVAGWEPLRTLTGHTRQVCSVAFSPDGQLLASSSDDKSVRLWRVADLSLVRTLSAHAGGVSSQSQLLGQISSDRVRPVKPRQSNMPPHVKPGARRGGNSASEPSPRVRRKSGVVIRKDGGSRPPKRGSSATSRRDISVSTTASLSTPRMPARVTGCS